MEIEEIKKLIGEILSGKLIILNKKIRKGQSSAYVYVPKDYTGKDAIIIIRE